MAIDLDIEIRGVVPVATLTEGTTQVLRDLVRSEPPGIRLERMIDGERTAPHREALGECDALYTLSFDGRDEEV